MRLCWADFHCWGKVGNVGRSEKYDFWGSLSLYSLIFPREAFPWVASCEERRFRDLNFTDHHFSPWPSPLSLWRKRASYCVVWVGMGEPVLSNRDNCLDN